VQLLGVFSQTSIANFDMSKLAFDDSEWVLDLGLNTGLSLFESLLHGGYRLLRVQRLAFAALHCNVPGQLAFRCRHRHVGAFVHPLIAGITIAISFLSMQKAVGLDDIAGR